MGEKAKKPPLIKLESLGHMKSKSFATRNDEISDSFSDTAWWVGLTMEIHDFHKFVWCENRDASDLTILNADMYDENRRKTIK